jgi:hypothetical protein
MGYAGNGTYRILVLISLSVFRDYILEPRYYNPYLLEYNNFTNYNGLDPWLGLGHMTFITMATGAHGAWPVCI